MTLVAANVNGVVPRNHRFDSVTPSSKFFVPIMLAPVHMELHTGARYQQEDGIVSAYSCKLLLWGHDAFVSLKSDRKARRDTLRIRYVSV